MLLIKSSTFSGLLLLVLSTAGDLEVAGAGSAAFSSFNIASGDGLSDESLLLASSADSLASGTLLLDPSSRFVRGLVLPYTYSSLPFQVECGMVVMPSGMP